jgi:hypothetical protein
MVRISLVFSFALVLSVASQVQAQQVVISGGCPNGRCGTCANGRCGLNQNSYPVFNQPIYSQPIVSQGTIVHVAQAQPVKTETKVVQAKPVATAPVVQAKPVTQTSNIVYGTSYIVNQPIYYSTPVYNTPVYSSQPIVIQPSHQSFNSNVLPQAYIVQPTICTNGRCNRR